MVVLADTLLRGRTDPYPYYASLPGRKKLLPPQGWKESNVINLPPGGWLVLLGNVAILGAQLWSLWLTCWVLSKSSQISLGEEKSMLLHS